MFMKFFLLKTFFRHLFSLLIQGLLKIRSNTGNEKELSDDYEQIKTKSQNTLLKT